MLDSSEIYAGLQISDDPLWSPYSVKTRERVRALKLLGSRQVIPVLLSALEKFEVQEVDRLLHLLEVLIVRYQLIGGGRTGRLEIASARLAHSIFTGEVSTATKARDAIKEVFPNDDDFRESFSNKQERNNQKVKYLLSRLEIQARREAGQSSLGDELEPHSSLTVEHVCPKSPQDEWSQLLQDDPTLGEEGTFRIGNECLLTGVNRSLGNRGFAEKRVVFGQSNLLLTKMIADESEWTRSQIESRQGKLAKLAVDHWRFQ